MRGRLKGLIFKLCIASTAIGVTSPAIAEREPPPPEPNEKPNWELVARRAVPSLKNGLFDPESAQIRWVSGFKWGYHKPPIGKRTYAWIACGFINAKNRMGGYVGDTPMIVATDRFSNVTSFIGLTISTCGGWNTVPVNPELIAATTKPIAPSAASVADELRKLAQLRDDRIITDAEFEAQKAKLLGN